MSDDIQNTTSMNSENGAVSDAVTKVASMLSGLSVVETVELVDFLQKQWGVSAAAPVTAAQASSGVQSEVKEEQTEFDLILKSVDASKKVPTIKVVRAITALALTEAKKMTESTPATLKSAMSKEDAEKAKAELEAVGATVELK